MSDWRRLDLYDFDAPKREGCPVCGGSYDIDGVDLCDAEPNFVCKCDHGPEPGTTLERSMKAEYEPLRYEWKQEVPVWGARQRSIEDAAWDRWLTPRRQAEQSLDRFLAHYFLTDGRPDPSKTRWALALTGLQDRRALHIEAEGIPGLETKSGGAGPDRTLYIGWNRTEVWALAREADTRVIRAQKARTDDRWACVLEEHQTFLEQAKKGAPKEYDNESPTPAVLQNIKGSYVLRCPFIEKNWRPKINLTLDIDSGPGDNVMKAAAGFDAIVGTMLLALTDADLDEYDVDSSGSDDGDEDKIPYHDDEEPPVSEKRAATAPNHKPGLSKKAKTDASTRHILLRIRGFDIGKGEIFYISEHGSLDFTDSTYTHFKGIVDLPHVGSNIEFEGFKMDAEPQKPAEEFGDFSDFSKANYEYERVARWR